MLKLCIFNHSYHKIYVIIAADEDRN